MTNYAKNYASTCRLSKPIYEKAKPEKGTWHHINHALKETLIRPVLNWKKPDLDKDNFKNYRPVANIPFQEKVIQRVVAVQTLSHLEKMPSMQSAYRKDHSTKTVLL